MTEPTSTSVRAPGFALGDATGAYDAAVEQARADEWATRLFDRDVTLWSDDPAVQKAIAERLGWLDAPVDFADNVAGLEGFGDGIVQAGFTTAVVAGMGGSSLAPDVLHRTFGSPGGIPRPAHPRFDGSRGGRRRSSTAWTRSRRWSSSPASPARRPSRTPFWRTSGTSPTRSSTRSSTTSTRSRVA